MEAKELITMIAEIIVTASVLIGGIAFIVNWCFKTDKRLISLENKIDDLPKKIKGEIFDKLIPSNIDRIITENNPLTAEQIQLRNRLLRKLQDHTITEDEAIKLRDMLEIENEEAKIKAKWDLIFSIGIVLAAIALALEIFKDEK